ncbi:MAG: ArsR family transcriptional regulator [Candidatus Kaiserbacteria bacterium]|nr:ArsR family transcriptional regulator [Candidatus Kaiserbacteria bacterium]MCB9816155.1 ArsR family transcriptional regulator [Candidatus Nomurabacteria bacterium]
MEKLTTILGLLGLATPEQTIYLSLLREGQSTARMLAARTSITRPSVYDQLKLLRGKGLVVELDIDGKTYFSPTNPEQLIVLMDEQLDELEYGRATLKQNLPALLSSLDLVQPKVRFFEGRDGVQQLMKDMLWHNDIELQICWPHDAMLTVLGSDFLQWFNERRQKRHITLKTIWPQSNKKQATQTFTTDASDVERRYLSSIPTDGMGYIIYANKVMFISSSKEAFGFVVDSAEFASLQRLQFTALWEKAKS